MNRNKVYLLYLTPQTNQNQRYECLMAFPGYEARMGFPALIRGGFKRKCVSPKIDKLLQKFFFILFYQRLLLLVTQFSGKKGALFEESSSKNPTPMCEGLHSPSPFLNLSLSLRGLYPVTLSLQIVFAESSPYHSAVPSQVSPCGSPRHATALSTSPDSAWIR